MSEHAPQFPFYIVSKGRSRFMFTSKALTEMKVPHFVVVEPQEVELYRAAVEQMKLSATVLELDLRYKREYELCDDLGLERSTGPGPARNFAWDHALKAGAQWHWVLDDNLKAFYRLNNNLKIKAKAPGFWRAMEDFALRYKNVAMAGPNYCGFAKSKQKLHPFIPNTRIYSCNLIRNSLAHRWRGRYNEDTILSLDLLKAGWCTIQFNAFLQLKMPTQTVPGGNTSEFYLKEGEKVSGMKYAPAGTVEKSKMLVKVHPDVSKMVWYFQRWHHRVDYTGFKATKLIRRPEIEVEEGANEFGMTLVSRETGAA